MLEGSHDIYINVFFSSQGPRCLICWASAFFLYFWSLIIWLNFSAYVKLFRPLGNFLSTYYRPSLSNFYFGCSSSLIQVSIYQLTTICKALNTTEQWLEAANNIKTHVRPSQIFSSLNSLSSLISISLFCLTLFLFQRNKTSLSHHPIWFPIHFDQ